MYIKFRNNLKLMDFQEDYQKIRSFLIKMRAVNYSFSRWDWIITGLDNLEKIGVWEKNDEIVALVTYDNGLGNGYFCVSDDYGFLKKEMLAYSEKAFSDKGNYQALINDSDIEFQNIASDYGFVPTQDREFDAMFPIFDPDAIKYSLPDGFKITSMADDYDLYKYRQVLWKGFNHEINGEGKFNPSDEDIAGAEKQMRHPNVELNLKIAVTAPNGDFVSYCGMWKAHDLDYAFVGPVATDPEYRKLGLGKAAVLEGVKRCGLIGAKKAFVGSSQQFYYNIGFRPYLTSTFWRKK